MIIYDKIPYETVLGNEHVSYHNIILPVIVFMYIFWLANIC